MFRFDSKQQNSIKQLSAIKNKLKKKKKWDRAGGERYLRYTWCLKLRLPFDALWSKICRRGESIRVMSTKWATPSTHTHTSWAFCKPLRTRMGTRCPQGVLKYPTGVRSRVLTRQSNTLSWQETPSTPGRRRPGKGGDAAGDITTPSADTQSQ